MSSASFFVVILASCLTAMGRHTSCPVRGQVYTSCGSACPPTCTDLNNLICTTQCVAGCQCPAGTVLDVTSNSCVTRDECPESACSIPGQVYNPCGSACPPNCTDLNPTCTKQCVAGCQCPAGTVLDVTSNSCVTIDECPDSACPVQGQGFTLCGSACPPNCTIPNPFCITLCVARCECPDGKVIDETSNSCVTLDKCPDSSRTCPPGQFQVNCLVDPCQFGTCPAHPDATCVADYCGGCNARFFDAQGKEVTSTCACGRD